MTHAVRTISHPEDEPWAKLTPRDVHQLLSDVSARWWVAGGWALDVRGTRPHGDIDVAVLRSEHQALRDDLRDWDLRVAHKGVLRPWRGGPVGPPENTVWARPTSTDPWHIDFKIELVDGDEWIYRRDPKIRIPLNRIERVVDGVPFLTPDVARLYKSGEQR
jgi:aminoglycoside-2''-adenylyltransferase